MVSPRLPAPPRSLLIQRNLVSVIPKIALARIFGDLIAELDSGERTFLQFKRTGWPISLHRPQAVRFLIATERMEADAM